MTLVPFRAVEKAPDEATKILYLDTLAATCYMNGDIARAIETEESAIAGATEQFRASFTLRREAYRKRLPAGGR